MEILFFPPRVYPLVIMECKKLFYFHSSSYYKHKTYVDVVTNNNLHISTHKCENLEIQYTMHWIYRWAFSKPQNSFTSFDINRIYSHNATCYTSIPSGDLIFCRFSFPSFRLNADFFYCCFVVYHTLWLNDVLAF